MRRGEIWDFSAWRREGLGIRLMRGVTRTEPDSFQWNSVTAQGAIGTN